MTLITLSWALAKPRIQIKHVTVCSKNMQINGLSSKLVCSMRNAILSMCVLLLSTLYPESTYACCIRDIELSYLG